MLTRCAVHKDEVGKKTIKIVPLKEHGEPVVVSVSVSQAKSLMISSCSLVSFSLEVLCVLLGGLSLFVPVCVF